MESRLQTLTVLAAVALVLGSGVGAVTAATVGVYFDRRADESTREVEPFEAFEWYIIATDVSEVFGFEFEVTVPRQITVTGRQVQGPAPLNVGGGSDNFIVGSGGCVTESDPILVVYSAMLLSDAESLVISLGPSSPSSTSFGTPAYLDCQQPPQILDFGEVLSGSINAEARSWGQLKNKYGQD